MNLDSVHDKCGEGAVFLVVSEVRCLKPSAFEWL